MEIESIKGLPFEEQVKELKKLKEQFAKEKSALKDQIFELEDSKKQKEAFAKNLVASQRDHSAAEVSVIVSSIKNVKGVLTGKNKELQFVERAIKSAEDMLKKKEQELEDEEERHEFELLLEQLIVLYKKEEEKRHIVLESIIDNGSNGTEEKVAKKKAKEETQLEDELEGVQTERRRRKEQQDYIAGQQEDYMPNSSKQDDQEGNTYIPKRPDDEVYQSSDESRQLYDNKNEDYVPNRAPTIENSKEFESEKDKLMKKIKQYESGR